MNALLEIAKRGKTKENVNPELIKRIRNRNPKIYRKVVRFAEHSLAAKKRISIPKFIQRAVDSYSRVEEGSVRFLSRPRKVYSRTSDKVSRYVSYSLGNDGESLIVKPRKRNKMSRSIADSTVNFLF